MADSGKRVLSRQKSVMTMGDNPFQTGQVGTTAEIKAELIADAVLITEEQFEDDIMSVIRFLDDNEMRLSILEEKKQPYLFTSDHLMQLTDLTPSLKTRLAMICMLAPRLTDPAAKSSELKDMFRFNSEKERVDEVLQERTRTIQSARFTNTGDGRAPILFAGAGRGASGGRGVRRTSAPQIMMGRGGRGRGMASNNSAHQLQNQNCPLTSIKAEISTRAASHSVSDFKTLRNAPCNTSTMSIDSEHGDVVNVDHETLNFDSTSPKAQQSHVPPLGRSPNSGRNKFGDDGSARTDTENFTPIGTSPSTEFENGHSARNGVPPTGRPQIRTTASGNSLKAMGMEEPPSPCNSIGSNSRAPTPTHAAALALEQHEYKSETVSIAPGFVFTARAPQRGPSPVPPRRTPSDVDLAASGNASTANSSGNSTPVLGTSNNLKDKKKPGNTYKERVAEENAALGVSSSMVSSLRSKFQKDSSTEGIAATTSCGDDSGEGRRKHGVSSLVQNLAKSLSSNDNSKNSSAERAKEAQAAVAAGKVLRSMSSDEEHEPLDYKSRINKNNSNGVVMREKNAREIVLDPVLDDSPIKLALSPDKSSARNSKAYSTTTTPNHPQRKSSSYENPPDTVDKAKIDAEENFGSFSISQSGKPTGMVSIGGAAGCGFSISQSASADSALGHGEKKLIRRHSEHSMSQDSGASGSGKGGMGGSDIASMCAAALQMSKAQFLLLEEEGPMSDMDVAAEGGGEKEQSFRYRELVRRNYTKEYVGLTQTELERYMTEDEFETVFKRKKADFYKQPRWRQMEQKKKAMLF